jgi:outer membrane protein assembly factor BamB
MRTLDPVLPTLCGIILLALPNLRAANAGSIHWPQFRGPHASGVAEGFKTPERWNVETGENVRWQTPVPGLAHSCPIIWGDRVFLTTVIKEGEATLKVGLYGDVVSVDEPVTHHWMLLCLDKASGKVLWQTNALDAVPRVKRHPKASHCSSTPATDGQRVVAIFGSEGLFCFSTNGTLLWKKDLGPLDSGWYRDVTAQWGFASSPVIDGDRVIVQADVQTNSFLAAFALADGKELWRVARKDVPTWSTPTVVRPNGRAQILINGWKHSGGYDPATGKELWRLNGGGDIPVPTPIVAHGLVYLPSAHGRFSPMTAIRLEASGDITPSEVGATNAHIAWSQPRGGNYMQTPLVVGDLLYGCNDAGVLSCWDARTGRNFFKERIGGGGQGFTPSIVAADGKVYVTSETGNVYVVPVGEKFSVLATNNLGDLCMATPAISEGTIFFRTRQSLIAVGAAE